MASLFHSLTHSLTHFHSQPACGLGFAGGGGRWREDMASRGEGFGTERARLGGDALGTERARLAQGGFSAERARLAQVCFRGQFYKRNSVKRNF